ncbi:MAG: reverse transcriptase family protein [Bacteroidetes bacterium]|nr:reverse transcriptase family protein [Bacteroidota bacterium]
MLISLCCKVVEQFFIRLIKTNHDRKSKNHLQIAKPGKTEKRTIETPTETLIPILDRICDSLQWLYREYKTDAAYGFIRTCRNDADKRNIYTNAARHLGKKYLLNIDIDNFFYQVDIPKVSNIFNNYRMFSFDTETEKLMTRLVTYRGRLPMGSPASPPLSNFATIGPDHDLLAWARGSGFVYTRYVDDLSFSSNMPISQTHFSQISEILQSHRFLADPDKIKWFGKSDLKEITGLIVGEKISVPDDFIRDFEKDLEQYRAAFSYAHAYPDPHVMKWIEKLGQVIRGRIAFLQMVYGRDHPVYRKIKSSFENINIEQEPVYSVSWRYAGYDHF